MIETSAFEVQRSDLANSRVIQATIDPDAVVAAGSAVIAIDRFALTANNITYASYGDSMKYWDFFPAADGFGRIPVWGYGDVIATPSPALPVGTRVYGYFPMASHLVVSPIKTSDRRFVDGAVHRAALPAVYNNYERSPSPGAPGQDAKAEALRMILQPLVMTSFLIADFLDDQSLFGASQIVVSSASSKTSLGLGLCLKRLGRPGVRTIGLTSAGNQPFVDRTGAFDATCTYDDIARLDPSIKTVFVDMAGSIKIITQVHHQFRDALVYSCRVGATHWSDQAGRLELPGARPVFFFAPTQVQKRLADWGPGGFDARFQAAWSAIIDASSWLTIVETRGVAAIETAYQKMLSGKVEPSCGLVLRP